MDISPTSSALQAAQARLAVSAHNIANMNTEDYKARQAVQKTGPSGPEVTVTESDEPPDMVNELIDQKVAAYDFKANLVALKTYDQMLGHLINIKA